MQEGHTLYCLTIMEAKGDVCRKYLISLIVVCRQRVIRLVHARLILSNKHKPHSIWVVHEQCKFRNVQATVEAGCASSNADWALCAGQRSCGKIKLDGHLVMCTGHGYA